MKKTLLATAVAAAMLAGTVQAGDTEVIIYKQPNFRGASYLVNGEVANIEGGLAREGSSLIVKGGYWEICSRDHFQGRCRVVEPGQYPNLPPHWDDRIVSVRFLGNDSKLAQRVAREDRKEARASWNEEKREARREERDSYRYGAIDLYGQPGFRGRSLRVEDNMRDLAEARFDGRASSVIVHSGTWQLCSEPRFQGTCTVVRRGEYPQLAALDDRISSVRQLY